MRQHKESAQSLSYHIALGGIIAALCIACMFLTGVFPMFYLILPMLASAFIYIMVLETSGYWGFLTYLSVGLLSIFVTPNKDASLAFLFFFGYFPLPVSYTHLDVYKRQVQQPGCDPACRGRQQIPDPVPGGLVRAEHHPGSGFPGGDAVRRCRRRLCHRDLTGHLRHPLPDLSV